MKEEDCKKIIRQMCVNGIVVEELGIDHGKVIADIANLDGEIWYGYEIKTEFDTLKRLPIQVPYYDKIFDYCYIFVHAKHVPDLKNKLPPHWGIIVYTADSIKIVKEADKNTGVNKMLIADLMWKAELLDVLMKSGSKRISKLNVDNLRKLAVNKFSPEELKLKSIEKMKSRTNWKPYKGDMND